MPVCTGMTDKVMDAGLHRHDKERKILDTGLRRYDGQGGHSGITIKNSEW